MASTLMASAISKRDRDRYIKILKDNGYRGIKVRVIHGKKIFRDRIYPATYYDIWTND